MTDSQKTISPKRLILYFCVFFLFFLLTGSGHFYVVDELTRYNVTRSMWEKGAVDIEDGYGKIGRDGKLYGKYGMLQSVVALPLYAAGSTAARGLPELEKQKITILAVSVLNQIVTALVCVLMMLFAANRLGLGERGALATAVVFATCTMAWQYSRTFFAEPMICVFLLAQVYIATGKPFREEGRGCFALGFLSALNILTRSETVIYGFVFFVLCLAVSRGKFIRGGALFGAPVAAAAGFLLWFNFYRFGNAMDFGYAGESFSTPIILGLYQLLFSTGKGVFFFSPAILLFFPAAKEALRKDRYAFYLVLALILIPAALYTRWNLVGGDLSWGPRYLLTCVMLMSMFSVVGVRQLLQWKPKYAGAAAATALLAVSLFVQVMSVAVSYHVYTDVLFAEDNPAIPVYIEGKGMDLVYYIPKFSPLSAHSQALIWMLDHDYTPPLFYNGNEKATQAFMRKYFKPDFTVCRYLSKK